MKNGQRIEALPRLLFGGENFAQRSASELKRALVIDGICLLILLLGIAGAALGQSQDQQKDQKPPQQQASGQSSPQTAPAQAGDSVAEAARKAKAKKTKKVYGEEDLANLRGGISVVGDAKTQEQAPSDASAGAGASGAGAGAATGEKKDEQYWRGQAQKIHAQMDATDEQIKNLKEDIKKNGAAGFDPQKGLRENVIYVDDKNARVKQLEDKKQKLDQALDQLQEQARKAGVPSEWVR